MQPDITAKPTGTLVLLTNPERETSRAKATILARRLKMRRIPLSTFIRWAVLNVDVNAAIDSIEVEQDAEAA